MTGMSLFKLGDRRGASPRGLSCNRDGVFLGEFALVKAVTDARGRRVYRARSLGEINAALSAAYGREVEFASRLPGLRQAARYLAENKLALAQIAAVQLRLPDLPNDAAALRLRKVETLLRYNPNHRGPGPGGGQFTSASDSGSGADLRTNLSNDPTALAEDSSSGSRRSGRAETQVAANDRGVMSDVVIVGGSPRQERLLTETAALLADPRIGAFLDTIAQVESGGDYNRLNGPGRKTFDDFSTHPVTPPVPAGSSSAAGAFQILNGTWARVGAQLGLKDFSPDTQDLIATRLLAESGAIALIQKGDIVGAIYAAGKLWDALPSEKKLQEGKQPLISVDQFISRYNRRLNRH